MRAAQTLTALSATHNVYFVAMTAKTELKWQQAANAVWPYCVEARVIPVPRRSELGVEPGETYSIHCQVRQAVVGPDFDPHDLFPGVEFDAYLIQRLYIAPFLEDVLRQPEGQRPPCLLDLDDYESKTRRRIAGVYLKSGLDELAQAELVQETCCKWMEERYLRLFDSVWLCSQRDADEVAKDYPGVPTTVIPNSIVPPETTPAQHDDDPFTFVFVGTLGWTPNQEGAFFFAEEVLPILRERSTRRFHVIFAGRRAPEERDRMHRLVHLPEVEVTGWFDEVGPYYERSHAAIVPLFAGGGTRIKILEAFAHDRPVIATPIGAEGLAVENGKQILIAGDAGAFAEHCLTLMENEARRRELAAAGREWVLANHTLQQVSEAIERSFNSVRVPVRRAGAATARRAAQSGA